VSDPEAAGVGGLDPEAADKLVAYAALVRRFAPRLDLVSPADLDRLEERHIADSLRILPLVDACAPGPLVDVGSGAGFPGVPLAIARPATRVRLLEPRRRRAAFLEEVVRDLGLRCDVVQATAAEAARSELAAAHSVGVARALAPPPRAFELIGPLLAEGGVAVVFVGDKEELPPDSEMWAPGVATMRWIAQP
jgi:16S rRNA (guanine527-N7)-methyltransferase